MFKRDTRIDRGELEGILHATDSAVLSGNRRVLYGDRDGEEKIGAGDRWKDWVSIEGRDR